MPTRTIRSAAHRHILVWLRHGSSTVSEIAAVFGMRMPHASLACRQLREAGLITRDESGGLRNAPLFLSQRGVERLREDAVSKMLGYADVLSSTKASMVLHADDTNVLLAYTQSPVGSLVFVSNPASLHQEASSGNRGGVWVHAPKANVRWYHLNDGSPAEPPLSGSNTLADFEPTVQRVGLVRGEVFEVRGETRLVEGQFFSAEVSEGPPPYRLQMGEVEVGHVAGTSHAYFPEQGLRGHLNSALNRSLFLQSLGQGALEIGDRYATKHRTLPYDVLKEWLRLKHPRMNQQRILELHGSMVSSMDERGLTSPNALEREVLMDFGRVSWTSTPLSEGYLDLYGMTARGASALVQHLIHNITSPFIIDWPFEDIDSELLTRLLEHPLCRSFVSRRGPPPSPGVRGSVLTDGDEIGVVTVRQGRAMTIQIQLNAPSDSRRPGRATPTPTPADARELMQAHAATSDRPYTGERLDGEVGHFLAEALRLYPEGDERQANMWEREHPLAAWIASPGEHRPARWMRLHARLPEGWTDLLPVEALPLEDLPQAMLGASSDWQRLALRRLQATPRVDAGVLLQWRKVMRGDSPSASAHATCLLCALDAGNPEEGTVFREATEVWFNSPMCEQEVLETVMQGHHANQSRRHDVLPTWVALAEKQPKTSLLFAWSTALGIAQNKQPWVPETQRLMMERLPLPWWAMFAGQWLTVQLGSHTGRTWLQSFSCPWIVQLARPEGEQTRFPGLEAVHPGFRLTTEHLLGANLLGDEDGSQHLRELYEMVYAHEQGLPVPMLAKHPFGGWLVRPVEDWPRFGSEVLQVGDAAIGELLFARSFAAQNSSVGR